MESSKPYIKPAIPTDDISAQSLLTLGASEFKQSRYEDVWPEDVHAAFMEAVALYPPMGKRRLRYYRISTQKNEHLSDANRFKSFGRCQLIQSYILEKTGKNRSRKQVSSHLQRLKKIHKDDPAMHFLFSEHSQPPSDHYSVQQAVPPVSMPSQDILSNISPGTPHFKSNIDFTVNIRKAENTTNNDNFPTFPYVSDPVSAFHGTPDLWTNRHNGFSQELDLLSPQQSSGCTFRPFDSDYFSAPRDPLLFKEVVNGGFRADSALNTSAISISMRHLAPREDRTDSYPKTHMSHENYTSAFQPAHRWTSYDDMMDSFTYTPLLTPARQWFHAPFISPGFPSDNHRISEIPYYLPTVYQPDLAYSKIGISSPAFQSSPSESEGSQLSEEISYSFVANPTTVSEDVLAESTIDFSKEVPSENLALPPVIRPTPIYPISYVHWDDGAYMPASNLPLPYHSTATKIS